jgi:hypothetical protein
MGRIKMRRYGEVREVGGRYEAMGRIAQDLAALLMCAGFMAFLVFVAAGAL